MRCRALSKNHHVIWFGKDLETPNKVYYSLNNGEVGYTGKPASSDLISIQNKDYKLIPDDNSPVTGKLQPKDQEGFVGVYSLTTMPVQNYVSDTDAVVASLIQRLSLIKGELWYQVNYGIPLTENTFSVALFDSVISDIIVSHPSVAAIENYQSYISGNTYYYTCKIKSIFAESAEISNNFYI